MEALVAIAVGTLTGCGIYLILRARTFPVILGLSLLAFGVNLFLVASGRLTMGTWPIITEGQERYPDPLTQALVLTAIVIGFAMTAFVLVLALRARYDLETDHVDGVEAENR